MSVPGNATRVREETPTTSHGSRTLTQNETHEEQPEEESSDDQVGVLRLVGDMTARPPRSIRWDDSVVDNEHLNRKKTKICCIYHKPHVVGQSDSDSSSSDSSSSDSDSDDDGRARHSSNCNHNHKKKRNPREVSPNAYEKQPVYKDRPKPPSND